MATLDATVDVLPSKGSILDRDRIIASPAFSRWLVPPAALAIHLCIGMAYGFSVFWLPLSKAIRIKSAVTCSDMNLLQALVTTSCDWRVADLGWMFTLFFVALGISVPYGVAGLSASARERPRSLQRFAGAVDLQFRHLGFSCISFG